MVVQQYVHPGRQDCRDYAQCHSRAYGTEFDEKLLDAADTFDRPMTHSDEATTAIEIALDLAQGDWSDASDLIARSALVDGAAKAMAMETLSQEQVL